MNFTHTYVVHCSPLPIPPKCSAGAHNLPRRYHLQERHHRCTLLLPQVGIKFKSPKERPTEVTALNNPLHPHKASGNVSGGDCFKNGGLRENACHLGCAHPLQSRVSRARGGTYRSPRLVTPGSPVLVLAAPFHSSINLLASGTSFSSWCILMPPGITGTRPGTSSSPSGSADHTVGRFTKSVACPRSNGSSTPSNCTPTWCPSGAARSSKRVSTPRTRSAPRSVLRPVMMMTFICSCRNNNKLTKEPLLH